jgi:hypothetical protein
METARWELGKHSLRRSEDSVGLINTLRRLVARDTKRSRAKVALEGEREEQASQAEQRLHDMATRLHVLEWEAYGQPKRKRDR